MRHHQPGAWSVGEWGVGGDYMGGKNQQLSEWEGEGGGRGLLILVD